jgi:hypothetical protein
MRVSLSTGGHKELPSGGAGTVVSAGSAPGGYAKSHREIGEMKF